MKEDNASSNPTVIDALLMLCAFVLGLYALGKSLQHFGIDNTMGIVAGAVVVLLLVRSIIRKGG